MTNLGNMPVPEERYRADLELLSQYQGYSTEIVRLSLLGIAGLAFFLLNLAPEKTDAADLRDGFAGAALGVSSLLFILATGCALSHRYHSSDGLHYHIKSIRFSESGDSTAADKAAGTRNQIYRKSSVWLGAAVSLFGAGGFFFVLGFGRLIYLWVTLSHT